MFLFCKKDALKCPFSYLRKKVVRGQMRQVGGKWVARLCKASCNLLLWLQWYFLVIVLRIQFSATKTARLLSKISFWKMQYLSQYIWKRTNYQGPHHQHQVLVNSPNFSQSPRFPPRSVQDDVRRWKKMNVRLDLNTKQYLQVRGLDCGLAVLK